MPWNTGTIFIVGFWAEISASPDPECPMMQISLSKSMEYISDSWPAPAMVFKMDIAMATLISPSTAQATLCLMSIENAGISMESSTPAAPLAKPS